jgi:hypothetical protein
MTDLDSIKGWQSAYFLVLASKRVLKEHSSVVLFIKEIVPWTLNTRYYHVGTKGYRVSYVIVPWTLNRFPKIPEPLYYSSLEYNMHRRNGNQLIFPATYSS